MDSMYNTQERDGAELQIEDLFNKGRVKATSSTLAKALFAIYVPFGVVLCLVRIFLFMFMCFSVILLPRNIGDPINTFLLRAITGLIVKHNRDGPAVSGPHVIACNHVSDFDTFAIWMTVYKYYVLTSAHLKALPILGAVYAKLGAIWVSPTPESRAKAKDTMQELLKSTSDPLVVFPEGGLTSGKTGVMMYHKFIFSLDVPIVPGAIRLLDPWPVEHDYIGSSWLKNFFWFMAVPFHIFEIVYLPPIMRNTNELPEEFAERCQQVTAEYLKIVPTKLSYSEKKALVQRLKSGKSKTA